MKQPPSVKAPGRFLPVHVNRDKEPSTGTRAANVAIPRAPEWSQMPRIWRDGPHTRYFAHLEGI